VIFERLDALRASGFVPQVCIVGSGPAGMSLALSLGRRKVPCLLLEAGGETADGDVQDAYAGSVVGDPYVDLRRARLRCLGGTSGLWEGWCRPLDAVDFEARAGMPDSGWPIRKADLDPYTHAAEVMLDLPPLAPDRALNAELNEVFFNFGHSIRFGAHYHDEIAASPHIALLLNAPVVDIVPRNGRIDAVDVAGPSGPPQRLRAAIFCLCTGGIENSRLLLWANERHRGGVVPDARTLGRYWMEHPHFGVGDAVVIGSAGESPTGMRFFAPSAQALRERGGGNFGVRMYVGINRLKRLLKSGLCVAPQFFDDLVRRHHDDYACGMHIFAAWEQSPQASNRIELDTERDALGMPRVKLTWRKQPIDRQTVTQAMMSVGRYLAETDIGRVRMAAWLAQGRDYPDAGEPVGFHHMGGTRMASGPDKGIVDGHCRVFGVDNLYIGGSSVFPTGGHANPTFTIVQLALRLADHLAVQLGRSA